MELALLNETILTTELWLNDDQSLEIAYRIGALGPEFAAWLNSPEGGLSPGSVYEAIARTCVSIGVTVDGAPVPCTAEALKDAQIPPQILHAILRHIREQASLGKLNDSRLLRISPRAAR